jgi:hypothetical protein
MIRSTTLWGSAVRRLVLALWVGGVAAMDRGETPVRFRTLELPRKEAVAGGRRVFPAVNQLEVCRGLLLLLIPQRCAQRPTGRYVGMMMSYLYLDTRERHVEG